MKNLKTEIEEILEDGVFHTNELNHIVDQLLSLFQKEVEGIIGEDNHNPRLELRKKITQETRNKLRAEQRKKLKELKKG